MASGTAYCWSPWLLWAFNPLLHFSSFLQDFIHATRAFMFFGMIAGAVSCIILCGTFFDFQCGFLSQARTSAIASLAAAGCVLIAMATFTGREGTVFGPEVSYGWSFGLGWASFPLFLITGGLAFPLDTAGSA
ncbi:protein NKG7-like [Podarcis raffonei]|uniref:protein NKG7-like n=1 Tax=Podarcis raffonei TaxID=65483 RepID=UPI002329416C|nr:protein NKG7-like [Podarcis raffonei]